MTLFVPSEDHSVDRCSLKDSYRKPSSLSIAGGTQTIIDVGGGQSIMASPSAKVMGRELQCPVHGKNKLMFDG